MKLFRPSIAAALLATSLAASLAANVGAAPAPDAPSAPDAAGPDEGMHHRHQGFGDHGPGAPGPDMPSAHLHGMHRLNLSEAQQDKLFAIEHAAEPQRREQDKAIHKAHEALRELGRAERFDEARAASVSRDLGQAVAAQALAEARLHAQVLAVLTPEQREQLRGEPRGERRPGAADPAAGAAAGSAPGPARR